MSAAGTALLIACAMSGALSAVLWLLAARIRHPRAASIARTASWLAVAASAGAAVVMLVALIGSSTDLAYARRAIEPGLPLYYRVTSLWAGMEGSLLLWLIATALVAAMFAITSAPRLPARVAHIAAAVLGAMVAAFAVVALWADPFAPAGSGAVSRPSPLLQDHPAMGLHPPLLYAGFTLLAVPFALAIGAAFAREWGAEWRTALRRWSVAAWLPLTAGIALGAWWSYAVLGWGGYWAWDPVENASLLPWLAATGLLHSIGATTRRGGVRWAVLFALLAYLLVLLATFLTRSGAITSIHAFSVSPVGPVLLGILAAATALAIASVSGAGRLPPRPAPPRLRDAALAVNRWGMLAVAAIVLAGSVLPTVLLSFWGRQVSVGPPWYERVLAPIAFVLLLGMALAPWLRRRSARRALAPAVVAALVAGLLGFATGAVEMAVVGGLGAFVIGTVIERAIRRELRRRAAIGGAVAHVAVVLGAIAVVAGGGADVAERTVPVGGAVQAGETTAVLVDVEEHAETRRTVQSARVLVAGADGDATELRPELRWYDEHGVVLAGPAIRAELAQDVYVTLLRVDQAEGVATIRLAVNPLMSWLWASVAGMLAGVAIAGWPASRGSAAGGASRGGAAVVADRELKGAR